MTHSNFVTWLEAQRRRLRLTKEKFALLLRLGSTPESAARHYAKICKEGHPFPQNHLAEVAAALDITLERLLAILPNTRHQTISPRRKLSEEDLLTMLRTVRLAGKPLPVGHLMNAL